VIDLCRRLRILELQLNNHWMESLDYRYHTIALNHFGAKARPTARYDSSSRRATRRPNWLDTAGHRRARLLRWWRETAPDPRRAW